MGYRQNWLDPDTRKNLGKPLTPAIIRAVTKQINSSSSFKEAWTLVGKMVQQDREALIGQVQRWLLASFLEQKLANFTEPSDDAVLKTPNAVYILCIEDLRRFATSTQDLRQSLLDLVKTDGIDTIIKEELASQQKKAASNMADMMRSLAAEKSPQLTFYGPILPALPLRRYFAACESKIARLLVLRAWAYCFVNFQGGMGVALTQLINNLLLQQQRSAARIADLEKLFNANKETEPIVKYYTALIQQIQEGN